MSGRSKKWLRIVLSAVPMVVVMITIFVMSGQQGTQSSGTSDKIGEVVLDILDIEVPPGESASDVPIVLGFNIRKLAHIFLYVLLGATSFLFMSSLPLPVTAMVRPAVCAGGALVISFAYACLDEFHQYFISGRDGKMADVGVDSIGFITAVLIITVIWYIVLLIVCKRTAV